MLIPRFSMRLLLVAVTLCAIFSYVLLLAVRGHTWAIAAATGFSSIALVLGAHALVFCVAWSMAVFFRLIKREPHATSPFASAKRPPQHVVPPEDVE